MGNLIYKKKEKKQSESLLHLINFNSNSLSNNIHNNNIFINFVNCYKNKDVILCGQGFRNFDLVEIKDNSNYFLDAHLGLLIYTNLNTCKFISYVYKNQSKYDVRKYGFIKNKINYKSNQLVIYNTEIISNHQNNIIFNDKTKSKQIKELIYDIYKYNCKINIIFACIQSYNNKIKKFINISNINNILNSDNDSYIFIYSKKMIDEDGFDINNFLNDEFKLEIIEENIYNHDKSYPFELVIKLKKL